ncbi:MAG TPA: hypothetical protein VFP98_04780 [Candidatus Polarisedimenticolia bacterium]|nr:hypothetical protein [Candidatus Polarisedimenticolia bacterium]
MRTIVLAPLEADGLETGLALGLPAMMEAAMESAESWEVQTGEEGAAWRLELQVSGKGPWKISARVEPTAAAGAGGPGRSLRIRSRRLTFGDGEGLATAVENIAAELTARWVESDPATFGNARTTPLAQALTNAPSAARAYYEAIARARAGQPATARELLAKAIADDPGFILAASEAAYHDLLVGDAAVGRKVVEAAIAGEQTVRSPLAQTLARAMEHLLLGQAARAYQQGEYLRMRAPHSAWARRLRGLSLAEMGRPVESLEDWVAVAASEPGDARGWLGLGRTAMAAGRMQHASDALARASAGWPDRLDLYVLQAEALARLGETTAARETVERMDSQMQERAIAPSSDRTNPSLMLGCLHLMEGHYPAALKRFMDSLESLTAAGAGSETTRTLHETIIGMRRDMISSNDPLTRERQMEDALAAVDRLEASLPPGSWERRPWERILHEGLIKVRHGETIEGWRLIERLREFDDQEEYSGYEEAYLTAVVMRKEGDMPGAAENFERAAALGKRVEDLLDLGQARGRSRRLPEALESYRGIEKKLERYDATGEESDILVLTRPRLAALLPLYHYARGRLGFQMGDAAESRRHFSRMLKYFQRPDEQFMPLVREAYDRGAVPE